MDIWIFFFIFRKLFSHFTIFKGEELLSLNYTILRKKEFEGRSYSSATNNKQFAFILHSVDAISKE